MAGPNAVLRLSNVAGSYAAVPLVVTLASGGVRVYASAATSTQGTNPIASYTFSFGDGSSVQGPQGATSANHLYKVAGVFLVTVTVIDSSGLSDTDGLIVTINNGTSPTSPSNPEGTGQRHPYHQLDPKFPGMQVRRVPRP